MKRELTQLRLHFKGTWIPILMNVIGMTIAFVAAIVILIQVYYEVTYDTFHENVDRIYKLQIKYPTETPDSVARRQILSVPFVTKLLCGESVSEVKQISYSYMSPDYKTWHGETQDFALPSFMVDSSFVDMFSFELVSGSLTEFNEKRNVALIPESLAMKQWGRTDIAGVVIADNPKTITVAGVYKDFPANSVIKNYVYVPRMQSMINRDMDNWGNWSYSVFVELKDSDGYGMLLSKADDLLQQVKKDCFSLSPLKMDEWEVDLIPIADLHYISELVDSNYTMITKKDVMLLFVLSLVILMIAGFNFTNFSISLIPKRMRKVNLHRIMGAERNRILLNIMGESVIYVVLSWIFAMLVILIFADEWLFSTSSVRVSLSDSLPVFVYTLVGAVVVGVLIGLFPAIYLTRIPSQIAIKRHWGLSRKWSAMQDVLLTLQLFCSISLIACTCSMLQQERYLMKGGALDNERLLFSFMKDTIPESAPLYEGFSAISGVEGVALSRSILTSQDYYNMTWGWNGVIATVFPVSRNYIDVMGVDMLDGRGFNDTDTFAIIFNETAYKKYPEKISVGKTFAENDDFLGFKIVGICKDINFKSLRREIEPMAFVLENDDRLTCVNVKLSKDANREDLKLKLAEALDNVDVNYKHSFRSLDEIYVSTYRYEILTTNRIMLFALVAIIISFMGLCSIVLMNGEYRLKEIAVKRVMGASAKQILKEQLLRYFVISLVAISASIPVYMYVVNNQWLSKFSYHIEFTWWLFAVSAILVTMLVLLVVALFIARYLHKNPVEILKYE